MDGPGTSADPPRSIRGSHHPVRLGSSLWSPGSVTLLDWCSRQHRAFVQLSTRFESGIQHHARLMFNGSILVFQISRAGSSPAARSTSAGIVQSAE